MNHIVDMINIVMFTIENYSISRNTDASVMRNVSYGVFAALCWNLGGTFVGASSVTVRNFSDPETLEALAVT